MADEAKQKFATERTARFQLGELSRIDENTISNIEEFGCSIVQVSPLACAPPGEPPWAYTIGIFDTCGRPEVITVGLNQSTARYLLNEAASLLRDGVDLTNGRQKGLLETVDCEFRTVDPKWIPKVMGWAKWFYDGTEFPILQAIYPDLENRFPWEPGFNERFQQPMLQKDAAFGDLERRFWEGSLDPKIGWKFPDDPHRKVFLSEAVGGGDEPITYVSHDSDDGAWQFLGDSMAGDSGPVLQCLHQVVELDPSLTELADLPRDGWRNEKSREPHGSANCSGPKKRRNDFKIVRLSPAHKRFGPADLISEKDTPEFRFGDELASLPENNVERPSVYLPMIGNRERLGVIEKRAEP